MALANNQSNSGQLGFRRIGVIVAPQGLQGEVRVKPYNENPDWVDSFNAQALKEVAVMPTEVSETPTGF